MRSSKMSKRYFDQLKKKEAQRLNEIRNKSSSRRAMLLCLNIKINDHLNGQVERYQQCALLLALL